MTVKLGQSDQLGINANKISNMGESSKVCPFPKLLHWEEKSAFYNPVWMRCVTFVMGIKLKCEKINVQYQIENKKQENQSQQI